MIPLAAWEDVIDASGAAPRIEAMLPIGVRHRQLSVRTLLAGMCLTQADGRPAHLTRVHRALTSLPEDDQARPGVTADWNGSPHPLTYRQTKYTFGLVAGALGKDEPDGLPPDPLQGICDDLLEASVPEEFNDASTSLAVDWTDLESFSRPPPRGTSDCAGPEASWGHRKNNLLRSEDGLFYGWYLSAAIMMREENRPTVPELARRATVSSGRHDPVRAFTPVLTVMPAVGASLGDILDDSGYAHRDADAWALPLRAAPPGLLHPADDHRPGGRERETRQKHDYPPAAWRRSYARRIGAERGFATAKDPATNDISRGWCRLMGPAPLMLFVTTLPVVRHQRILHAWITRQQENARRAAKGLPPKTRRRRRRTLNKIAATAPP